MTTMNTTALTFAIPNTFVTPKAAIGALLLPLIGLPQIGTRGIRLTCSATEKKASTAQQTITASSMLAMASVMGMSSPAMALVDERMSTEGVGLPLGLSNNLLGWILAGVFALIWSLYFVWTSSIEEDDDSGLSL